MKLLLTVLIASLICVTSMSSDASKDLISQRVKELKELNDAVLENSKILENYNNQSVYVKARLIEKDNNSFELLLKEVSSSPIDDSDRWYEPSPSNKNNDIIYLQGKVIKTIDTKFKIDIDSVLPPEPKNINSNNLQDKNSL